MQWLEELEWQAKRALQRAPEMEGTVSEGQGSWPRAKFRPTDNGGTDYLWCCTRTHLCLRRMVCKPINTKPDKQAFAGHATIRNIMKKSTLHGNKK